MLDNQTKKMLRIGQLANMAGVSPRTVRFYISQGLLPKPLKTHRNMAYYPEDFVSMIKAIKKAQSERYLPLVTIRQMLEESGFDHSSLNVQEPPDMDSLEPGGGKGMKSFPAPDVPPEVLGELSARGWISVLRADADRSGEGDSTGAGEITGGLLLDFLNECRGKGMEWRELIDALDQIGQSIEQLVECEFKVFFRRLADNPEASLDRLLNMERRAIREFINRTREQTLTRIAQCHNQNLDNAIFAVSDEGYGIPMVEIEDDLTEMESDLDSDDPDIDALVDLATGYSCAGALDRAAGVLHRVLRLDPGNVDAQVRLCWYQRFSEPSLGESKSLLYKREHLAEIVDRHPENVMGRLFLSIWHACDSLEADDSFESMRHINTSLGMLRGVEDLDLSDLHNWCLFQYSTGLILTCVLPSLGELEKGIEALNEVKAKRYPLDEYYARRMPFFAKWLWPNLFCLLGSAHFELGRLEKAASAFEEANRFNVSPLFRKRIEENLLMVHESLGRIAPKKCG